MKVFLVFVFMISAQGAFAKNLINCEGHKVFPERSIPSTLMLYPYSTLNFSTSTENAHYLLQILEKNIVVNRLMVLVSYRARDSRGNPDRFVITSNPWGRAVGHISANGLTEALLDIKKSSNTYETYKFQNCTKTF